MAWLDWDFYCPASGFHYVQARWQVIYDMRYAIVYYATLHVVDCDNFLAADSIDYQYAIIYSKM